MKIVRDDYEIDRVRAWAEEGVSPWYLKPNYCGDPSEVYSDGYAQGIADVLDWMKGETNIAPDR